jgi:hypothetical protein
LPPSDQGCGSHACRHVAGGFRKSENHTPVQAGCPKLLGSDPPPYRWRGSIKHVADNSEWFEAPSCRMCRAQPGGAFPCSKASPPGEPHDAITATRHDVFVEELYFGRITELPSTAAGYVTVASVDDEDMIETRPWSEFAEILQLPPDRTGLQTSDDP